MPDMSTSQGLTQFLTERLEGKLADEELQAVLDGARGIQDSPAPLPKAVVEDLGNGIDPESPQQILNNTIATQAGLWLVLGSLGATVCLLLGSALIGFLTYPDGLVNSLGHGGGDTGGGLELAGAEVASTYGNIVDAHWQGVREFALQVVGTLAPFFTLAAGYLFGQRNPRESA